MNAEIKASIAEGKVEFVSKMNYIYIYIYNLTHVLIFTNRKGKNECGKIIDNLELCTRR